MGEYEAHTQGEKNTTIFIQRPKLSQIWNLLQLLSFIWSKVRWNS